MLKKRIEQADTGLDCGPKTPSDGFSYQTSNGYKINAGIYELHNWANAAERGLTLDDFNVLARRYPVFNTAAKEQANRLFFAANLDCPDY